MRARFTCGALLAVIGMLAGCSDNNPAAPAGSFRDPVELVNEHAAAIRAMDAERYAALLEAPSAERSTGFRFHPRAEDLAEIPWLLDSSWGYDTELDMVGNLLDSSYVSDEIGHAVQSATVSMDVTDQLDLGDGAVQVTCATEVTILWAPSAGAYATTRLVMDLFPDADGYLRIRTIREFPLARVEQHSWASIKNLFRTPVGFADPSAVIQAHAHSLTTRDLAGYADQLDPAFVYEPQDTDVADFPWISTGHPWDRQEELGMIRHMMDPAFVSQETGNSVDLIEMTLTMTNSQPVADNGIAVTCSADILVLWAANTGASMDVRLVFTMYPDVHGLLRIRKIKELPIFLPPGPEIANASVESASWGAVKNLYR